MKIVVVIIFSWISLSAFAQVGRYEEPVDSIPIGGEIQENKQMQMEAQDKLTAQLIAVRDSLKLLPAGSDARDRTKDLDNVINGLESRDRSPGLMKKGYTLLNEIRGELKGGSSDGSETE